MSAPSKPVSSSDLSASRAVAVATSNLSRCGDIKYFIYLYTLCCACAALSRNLISPAESAFSACIGSGYGSS